MRAGGAPRRPVGGGAGAPLPWLIALAFLVTLDSRLLTPLLPVMAAALEASVAAVGLAATAYMLPYGLCQFAYGPLADRYGTISVVRLAAVGFGLAVAGTGLAPSVPVLEALRFATGAFAAAVFPLTLVYIGDSVPYAERQAAIGRFVAVVSLAQTLSAALGGTLAHLVSWRAVYALTGVAAFGPALALARFARDPAPRGRPARGPSFGAVLRRREARVLFGLVGVEGLFLWGAFTYVGALAVARFGLNELEAGLLVAVYGVGVLAGGLLLGRLRAWVPEPTLALVGGVLKGGGYLLMLPAGPVAAWALALLMMGLGYIALHTTLQTRATELAPEARGTAVALFAFCLFLGGSAGAAAFGPLVARGVHRAFLALCGGSLLALGTAAAVLLGRPAGRDA